STPPWRPRCGMRAWTDGCGTWRSPVTTRPPGSPWISAGWVAGRKRSPPRSVRLPSAREAAGAHERLFLRGAGAAQQLVAMGEAAKARDDVAVVARVTQGFAAQRLRQRHAAFVVGQL